jgi:hypothetical protein
MCFASAFDNHWYNHRLQEVWTDREVYEGLESNACSLSMARQLTLFMPGVP